MSCLAVLPYHEPSSWERGFNSAPKDKSLDQSKLIAFADNEKNATQKLTFVKDKDGKHCGTRIKCWLAAFSPFPTMLSKGYFLRVVKSRELCGKELIVI